MAFSFSFLSLSGFSPRPSFAALPPAKCAVLRARPPCEGGATVEERGRGATLNFQRVRMCFLSPLSFFTLHSLSPVSFSFPFFAARCCGETLCCCECWRSIPPAHACAMASRIPSFCPRLLFFPIFLPFLPFLPLLPLLPCPSSPPPVRVSRCCLPFLTVADASAAEPRQGGQEAQEEDCAHPLGPLQVPLGKDRRRRRGRCGAVPSGADRRTALAPRLQAVSHHFPSLTRFSFSPPPSPDELAPPPRY